MKNYKAPKEQYFNANNHNLECVEINGKNYCLNGWNGEEYLKSFRYGKNGIKTYEIVTIKPIYAPVGEPNEDGDFDNYEIVEYQVRNG